MEKKTVADLFGVNSPAFAKMAAKVFEPTPDTPKSTLDFQFQESTLRRLIIWASSAGKPAERFGAQMKRNVWLYGPTGCGKTKLISEFCARTGRSLFRFQCSEDTEQVQLFGTWKLCSPQASDGSAPAAGAGPEMTFVDGPVLRWARTPNSVLLLDEMDQLTPSVAMSLNAVLDGDDIVVPETGERIRPAEGCLIAATGNTNGRGSAGGNGGSAALYKGVKRQNIATQDRFFVINATYLSEEEETKLLMKQVKLSETLAKCYAQLAASIRKRFLGLSEDAGGAAPLEFTITTRNLLNWAMSSSLLMATGMPAEEAHKEALSMTLLDFGDADEREAVISAWTTIVGA